MKAGTKLRLTLTAKEKSSARQPLCRQILEPSQTERNEIAANIANIVWRKLEQPLHETPITGGSGFLGNLIARRLHARGDRFVSWMCGICVSAQGIEFVKCDIRDTEGVARAFMKGMDVCIITSRSCPLTKAGAEFWSVNVEGSRIAAEQAVKRRETFIHMSSSAIFGPPKSCPVTNDSPMTPVKFTGAPSSPANWPSRHLPRRQSTARRDPTAHDSRRKAALASSRFISVDSGEPKNLRHRRWQPEFQFVHAHDLMDAYMLARTQGKPGVYNVGAARFGTLRER